MICKLTKAERDKFGVLLDKFQQMRDALIASIDEIAEEWRIELDKKSERWLDSDAGQEAEQRLNTLIDWRDSFENDADESIPDDV